MSARLLILDDDADIRVFLSIALKAYGYSVEARRAPQLDPDEPPPDLVLVDLLFEGRALSSEQLRALTSRGSRAVIISGLQPSDPRVRAALAAGARAFLQKPFTLDELRDLVASALKEP